MHINVILCVFLIAHCGLSHFFVAVLQMVLPVNHVASPTWIAPSSHVGIMVYQHVCYTPSTTSMQPSSASNKLQTCMAEAWQQLLITKG